MYINREYSPEYFRNKVFSEKFIILTSGAEDMRSQKLLKEFSGSRCVKVNYSVKMSEDGTLQDSFSVKTNFESVLADKNYSSLYQELRKFVQQLNKESRYIIIDISGIHIRFLGALLATMTEWNWGSIICTYTEPTAYPRIEESFAITNNKSIQTGAFDLNSSFWGYDEIPNLKTITNERENYIWVVFLGFEGKRAAAVYTEISDDASMTIPVITMPSVRPGWSNYAFDANQILFENARIASADIHYVDALSPFATFNFLESVKNIHPHRHLVISPLGTRPVSLGVLLYALKNEESEVYFDTPKESSSKIISSGKIHIYDILSFFEE